MFRGSLISVGLAAIMGLGLSLVTGCEKDYTPVKPFHEFLKAPAEVNAELVENKRIVVNWEMVDPDSLVRGFVISISDTGQALLENALEGSAARTYSYSSSLFDTTQVDSKWYYIRVRAYDEKLFQGPLSDPDSVLAP